MLLELLTVSSELWGFARQWWAVCSILRHTDHSGLLVRRAVGCASCAPRSWEAIWLQKRWGGQAGAWPLRAEHMGVSGVHSLFCQPVSEARWKKRKTGVLTAAKSPLLWKPWRRLSRGAYCSRESLGLQSQGQRKHPSFLRAGYEMNLSVPTLIPPGSAIGVALVKVSNMSFPSRISLRT